MSQDVVLSMPALAFNHFSDLLSAFNRRTEKANKDLKKAKYQKVTRFPVGHVGVGTVTVCVAIEDRSKVLWQDLSGLLDKFKLEYPVLPAAKPAPVPAKPVSRPVQAPSRQWGLWVPCESEESARAAAGFLQAIAKVGVPQVECRG